MTNNNSPKISTAQSDLKRNNLNETANQLMMAAIPGLTLNKLSSLKATQEPMSVSSTTLSATSASSNGLLERQTVPALASQPVETMIASASKKKKKKMMKKKKMEKKHKEWKKGKKHKKKKFESKKKKGGSSKKKKGKLQLFYIYSSLGVTYLLIVH